MTDPTTVPTRIGDVGRPTIVTIEGISSKEVFDGCGIAVGEALGSGTWRKLGDSGGDVEQRLGSFVGAKLGDALGTALKRGDALGETSS